MDRHVGHLAGSVTACWLGRAVPAPHCSRWQRRATGGSSRVQRQPGPGPGQGDAACAAAPCAKRRSWGSSRTGPRPARCSSLAGSRPPAESPFHGGLGLVLQSKYFLPPLHDPWRPTPDTLLALLVLLADKDSRRYRVAMQPRLSPHSQSRPRPLLELEREAGSSRPPSLLPYFQ